MSVATSAVRPVLIAGQWRDASHRDTFQATDPNKNETLPAEFPVSSWEDCDAALGCRRGRRTRVARDAGQQDR